MDAFVAGGNTVSVSASTTTGSVALPTGLAGTQVRIYNAASVAAFVNFGDSTVTAATNAGLPIAPGAVEVLGRPSAVTNVAVILPSGTGTVYFTSGVGF